MSSGSKEDQPRASDNKNNAKAEPKHWLEYAIFLFVIATAVATGFAAWYTRQQWRTAEDTEKRSLRAYLALSATTPLKFDSERFTITIENFGQTPAKDFAMFSSWRFLPFGEQLPDNFDFPDTPGCSWPKGQEKMQPGIGVILPKSPVTATHNHCPEELDSLRRAERKEANAWLYGSMNYSDIFNERHITTFCALYWPFEQRVILCNRHNEIDPDE